jgi:RimJ/RimL family protein N-acetyltransferase
MSYEIVGTERLRLRAYTPADEADLFDVFADPYARRFYPEMEDRRKVRAWIEWNLRNYDEFGLGLWAMESKAAGGLIGDCGLTFQEVEGRRELEIGYHLIERERGKGYATEAARTCLDFGFTRTSCESICSIVRPWNTASRAVAARIHTARRKITKDGQVALLFHTTRQAWAELPCLMLRLHKGQLQKPARTITLDWRPTAQTESVTDLLTVSQIRTVKSRSVR